MISFLINQFFYVKTYISPTETSSSLEPFFAKREKQRPEEGYPNILQPMKGIWGRIRLMVMDCRVHRLIPHTTIMETRVYLPRQLLFAVVALFPVRSSVISLR